MNTALSWIKAYIPDLDVTAQALSCVRSHPALLDGEQD